MSIRYVWQKYNVDKVVVETSGDKEYSYGFSMSQGSSAGVNITTSQNVEVVGDSVKFTSSKSVQRIDSSDIGLQQSMPYGHYIGLGPRLMNVSDVRGIIKSGSQLTVTTGSNGYGYAKITNCRDVAGQTQKGQFQGYVSNPNSSAYPQDGVSGANWYDYQGSDNIDPTACSIPSTIMGGTQIQITVTPGTGKVYEGTVSYLYQVKLGDADWTTIATTTATSKNYTVPYGTTTFQVRVRAQDNLGFTSTDYVTSSSVTVINNQPPTAPGSIEVTNVVHGQQATITITAATDPDGTVESYIYERSVDGSAFTQIANVNALSQTDQVSADWGTVAYRVCAVDDDGDSGPYVTSETTTVNSGWIIISGPAADMGDKPAPFNFTFTPNVTGQTGVTDISVVVTLDGEEIYNDTPDAGQEVSLPIDTRIMRAGEHTIQVAATKTDFLETNGSYEFNIPAITLPDGGKAEQLQNPEGDVIFPYTLARLVIGKDGKDLNELLEGLLKSTAKIQIGTYTGTGTYGSANPNTLIFDFPPKVVLFMIPTQGTHQNSPGFQNVYLDFIDEEDTQINVNVFRKLNNGTTLTWHHTADGSGNSSAPRQQNNLNGYVYPWIAIGKSPSYGNVPVTLETASFSESSDVSWNFSIPEGTTVPAGESKSVMVTMTRGGETATWTKARYVTYVVTGADGSGKTANGLIRSSNGDPAPTFDIPISNVSGNSVKITITDVSENS